MNVAETLEKSEPQNLSVSICADLRMKLIVGDLKPGEPLSIRTLAQDYQVSAMPVREALRQLASADVLIGAAKKAYRVPDLTPAEAANLFFIRSVLEGAAAEIAATNMQDTDVEKLTRLTQDMQQAWSNQNATAFLRANFEFHSVVYGRANNDALQSIIDTLYARTGPWLAHGITDLVKPDKWQSEHVGIIDALRRKDGALARHLMEEDVKWGVDLYRRVQ